MKLFHTLIVLFALVCFQKAGATGGAKPDFFINNSRAFICDSSTVVCLDLASGKPAWTFTPGLHQALGESYKDYNYTDIFGFIFHGGELIINTGEGWLVSLNPSDGSVLWEKDIKKVFQTQPVAMDSLLFFGGQDSAVYAFSLQSREIKWKYKPGGKITNTLTIGEDLYFGTNTPYFYAVGMTDGSRKWTSHKLSGVPRSTPVIYKNNIYFGCVDGTVYNIDTDKGGVYYWIEFPNRTEEITPVVFNDHLVFKGSKDVLGIFSIKRLEGINGIKVDRFRPRSLLTRDSTIMFVDGSDLKVCDLLKGWLYKTIDIGQGEMSVPVITGDDYYYILSDSLMKISLGSGEKTKVGELPLSVHKGEIMEADNNNISEVFKNLAYPDTAMKQNIQGRVVVRCLLSGEGKIIAKYVHFCSDDIFLEPSLEALGKAALSPVEKNGRKSACWVNFTFGYVLE